MQVRTVRLWDWDEAGLSDPGGGEVRMSKDRIAVFGPDYCGVHDISVDFMCKCGYAMGSLDDEGTHNVFESWEGIDWESDENSYQEYLTAHRRD